MVCGLQFPLGASGCAAHMGGLTCLGIGLATVPRVGLICCLLLHLVLLLRHLGAGLCLLRQGTLARDTLA